MNLKELSAHLQFECYQPNSYHIGSNWSGCGDSYCIDRVGEMYEVFYVERGQRNEATHRCVTEAEACSAILAELDRDRFSRAHCVGLFSAESEANVLAQQLGSAGIRVHRDSFLFSSPSDFRYRIFVFGRDKIRAEEVIDSAEGT